MDEPQHIAAPQTQSRDQGLERPLYREPALVHLLALLWEHQKLVLLGSLLPTLLVVGILGLGPRQYTITYVYERPLSENEYGVFQRRFYSQENLDKMVGRLQEQGLTHYVQQLGKARTQQAYEGLIRFEVTPMYPKRLQTTDPCTSEKISSFRAKLLSVKIWGNSPEEVTRAAAVVTGNIESVLPLYDIRNYLKKSQQDLRKNAAEIEDQRFKLSMDLGKEQAKLAKFKALEDAGASGDTVVLQFGGTEKGRDLLPSLYSTRIVPSKAVELQKALSDTEKYDPYSFLPLSYQIRASQSKIVELQETLSSNQERHGFYLHALDLDNQLLVKIEERLLTYYTAQQYLQYLGEQLRACREPSLSDHLRSCIHNTENLALLNTRAGEKPIVYPMSKGAVKYGALTFVLGLMLMTLVAVVREHQRDLRGTLAVGPSGQRPAPSPRVPPSPPSVTTAPDQSPG